MRQAVPGRLNNFVVNDSNRWMPIIRILFLMKERLRIINQSIDLYSNTLILFSNNKRFEEDDDKTEGMRGKYFSSFSRQLVGSKKINDWVILKANVRKSNFTGELKSIMAQLMRFTRNLLNFRENQIIFDNFEAK